ncbi:GmrSD restriction endonuclease domain-containing protein [Luteococcus sediminum]
MEETFRYRVLEVLDANAVMPAVLWVIAHDVPADERQLALESLESWLVRRAILRLGSKDLNHITIDLIKRLRGAEAVQAGSVIREFLAEQTAPTRLWPDDASIVEHLQTAPFYKQAKRSVNRMLLEAAEEMLRKGSRAEELWCPRDLSVEHVMPQKWTTHWPLDGDDPVAAERRDLLVQTLGNLTLVTPGHNSALSNNAWVADNEKGKRDYLRANAVLKLNAALFTLDDWTESRIAERGPKLAELVVRAWPRPAGGPATKDLLASPTRQKRTTGAGRAVYEIHGPDFSESDLTRRAALRQMIQRVHAAGVSMELIGATMSTARFRQVPGILEGQELFHQLVARFGVNPDYESRWLLDQPIHEAGSTWVLQEGMGQNHAHTALDKLSAVADGFGWSTAARSAGGVRHPDDDDAGRWWCIHNDQIPGEELQAGGFVSIGWDLLGDLRVLGADREGIKESLRAHYPGAKEGAYTNWASMVAKFSHELEPGDWVISPVKASRTVDIGVITGPYWYEETAVSHRHRLPVQWMATGLDRDEFSLDARYEIGGALTLFRVRRTVAEFADQVELPLSNQTADLH